MDNQWRTSSHSGGTNCVEVVFVKSSRSAHNGSCVEAGLGGCGLVHVRDSKDRDGGVLSFSPAAWALFLTSLRAQ